MLIRLKYRHSHNPQLLDGSGGNRQSLTQGNNPPYTPDSTQRSLNVPAPTFQANARLMLRDRLPTLWQRLATKMSRSDVFENNKNVCTEASRVGRYDMSPVKKKRLKSLNIAR